MSIKKNSRPLLIFSVVVLSLLIFVTTGISKRAFGYLPSPIKAEFVEAHAVESKEMFLTDKVSDLVKSRDGYIVAEQYRSTLLFLDQDLNPIKRIGRKGNGPNDLNKLGAVKVLGDQLAVQDRGNRRIVFLDQEGQVKNVIKSDIIDPQAFNFNIFQENLLVVASPNTYKPIKTISLSQGIEGGFGHEVLTVRNNHQSKWGNKGFFFDFDGKHFYFPPSETYVEVMDQNFEVINRADFTELPFLGQSLKRAQELYNTNRNSTLQYYRDVYQDGNRFFLIAYSDILKEDGKYTRRLNHVIQMTYDQDAQKMQLTDVYELKKDTYYTQLLVEDNKLLAFNFQDFTIDEYRLNR